MCSLDTFWGLEGGFAILNIIPRAFFHGFHGHRIPDGQRAAESCRVSDKANPFQFSESGTNEEKRLKESHTKDTNLKSEPVFPN